MKPTALLLLALVALAGAGCSFDVNVYEYGDDAPNAKPGPEAHAPAAAEGPASIPPPTVFADGRLRFSAQPDEATLRAEIASGATTVVNFRRDSEMEALPFTEARVVKQAGASYVHIPLGGSPGEEPGYDPEDVDRLAEVLKNAEGNVYMHCASGTRARTIWTAYLVKYEGLSEENAILRAQKVGQEPAPLDRLLGKPSAYVAPERAGE